MSDALKLAFYRVQVAGKLRQPGAKRGAMISVNLSRDEVLPYLDIVSSKFGEAHLTISCINSPQNVTLSGRMEHLDAAKELFDLAKVSSTKLRVDLAYHSEAMNEVSREYGMLVESLSALELPPGHPKMFFSVTGARIHSERLQNPEYWVQNMISPVQFSNAFSKILPWSTDLWSKHYAGVSGALDFVEIGPHSALKWPIKDVLKNIAGGENSKYISMLVRGISAVDTSLSAVGKLYCFGHKADLSICNSSKKPLHDSMVLSDLPEHPFQSDKQYWHESRLSKNFRFQQHRRHELLGAPVPDWNPLEAKWRHKFRLKELPWIVDHKVSSPQILRP